VTNTDIAGVFEQLADILEYKGDNAFRIRAYRGAVRTISGLVESLASIRNDPQRSLRNLDGIGADLASKIETLLDTGRLPLLDELTAEVPAVVWEMLRVPGLGPRKVKLLVETLAIDSLDDLEQACQAGRVAMLKGFGEKTQQSILDNLPFARNPTHSRLLWLEADEILQELLVWIRSCPEARRVEGAGSWRRGCETVGDLDVVVESQRPAAVMGHLLAWQGTAAVLLQGDTKTSVRGPRNVQIDLRVVAEKSFGAAWQYFTGSQEHNVRLRTRARELGLSINEYGVYHLESAAEAVPRSARGPSLGGQTEEEVYRAVGLPWIPPELREGRDELLLAGQGLIPTLVNLEDIRGDLHMHTIATDGENSLVEMVRAAIERGLEYIAITDHSQRVSMARGLDASRLLRQWDDIDALNQSLCADGPAGIVVLKGIEVDMLEKGGLDLPDAVLRQADWVVASLHYGQQQPRDRITARILEAIANPWVRVIGHPTGRLINRRPPYDVDIEAVISAAAANGTCLEINANPSRLDLNEHHAAAAGKAGVRMVISTDAHDTGSLDLLRCGVLQARRAGLTAADIANTLPLAELLACKRG